MNLRLLLLASPLLLSGCFLSRIDHNRPLDLAVVVELRAGNTPRTMCLRAWERPSRSCSLGTSAWRYEYERTKQTGPPWSWVCMASTCAPIGSGSSF
ncbi:MAG: hypothetical protein R3E96_11105 [Planctomycetota bacterium]